MNCDKCNDTGTYKECLNQDAFDKEWDRLDHTGLSTINIYDESMDAAGYNPITPCPYCKKDPKYYRESKKHRKLW
ncbi:hypothetical protein SAMN02745163_03729 [Clostridium cavendishii DSM 21758]|uniref:Uncharacterized protein n=1 Tax=Clostridium cavendishii DSM 21758 TaxID=1121302 RepID=A0A1M6S1S8_9CLOT|nr:hypothetical protein [Clostridium cavendishii]SHK38670.1 hypothetical protein SAMN02745163_03729 [Clostridium cavendishii DSM 21758]